MTPVSRAVLAALGFVLFLAGGLYRLPHCERVDQQMFRAWHRALRGGQGLFRALWPLGTLVGGLVFVALFWLAGYRRAAAAVVLAYLLTVTVERGIKNYAQRPRPFRVWPEVQMGQPKEPQDASFPSGDALRIWLVAWVSVAVLPLGWAWLPLTLAVLVSLGRIALGVHYPCDVLAGSGLGWMAAALALALAYGLG